MQGHYFSRSCEKEEGVCEQSKSEDRAASQLKSSDIH
jgi:hypothetical protein